MKLYYSPGACSLAAHVALLEAALSFDLVKVDLRAKTFENGRDYLKVNPKGQVPALGLDGGEVLTEGAVIVQYIADQAEGSNLAPANGSIERYRLQEWLSFVASELHKNFSPLFNATIPEDVKAFFRNRITGKLKYVDEQLADRDYLLGRQFSVADGYLYTMLRWADGHKLDLSQLNSLMAFKARVEARPKVQQALTREGLMKVA